MSVQSHFGSKPTNKTISPESRSKDALDVLKRSFTTPAPRPVSHLPHNVLSSSSSSSSSSSVSDPTPLSRYPQRRPSRLTLAGKSALEKYGFVTGSPRYWTQDYDDQEDYFEIPPAPRLVGIEPNPGPVIKTLGSVLKLLPNPTPKIVGEVIDTFHAMGKKNSNKNNNKKKKALVPRNPGVFPSSNSSSQSVGPRATQTVYRVNRSLSRTHIESFNSGNLFLKTDSSGDIGFASGNNGFTGAAKNTCDLHPIINTYYPQRLMFGIPIARLASVYARWRFRKLTITFETGLGTAREGMLAVGFTTDPVISIVTAEAYVKVSSMQKSFRGPLWDDSRRMTMDVSSLLDGSWQYVTGAQNDNLSSQRLNFPGMLIAASPAALPPSLLVGCVRMVGEIEFSTLTGNDVNPEGVPLAEGETGLLSGSYFSTDLTATETAPFPTTGTSDLPPQLTLSNPTDIRIGRDVKADGIWRIRLTATDVTGVIVSGFTMTLSNIGNAISGVLTSSASAVPPYSAQFVFSVSGTGAVTDFVVAQFTGPSAMTSGNTQFTIEKLS